MGFGNCAGCHRWIVKATNPPFQTSGWSVVQRYGVKSPMISPCRVSHPVYFMATRYHNTGSWVMGHGMQKQERMTVLLKARRRKFHAETLNSIQELSVKPPADFAVSKKVLQPTPTCLSPRGRCQAKRSSHSEAAASSAQKSHLALI